MKIEKINENQIRCTLTRDDLASRHLKLSELAYGTEKAKSLFREMMQQASFEFGFETNDIPLMIEAIPLSAESIILIVTKVEDPEELDTRFAKFAPTSGGMGGTDAPVMPIPAKMEGADDILDLFNKLHEARRQAEKSAAPAAKEPEKPQDAQNAEDAPVNLTRIYRFRDLDTVIRAARVLKPLFFGANTLYRDPEERAYYLLISKTAHTPEEFNKVCNILSEYGSNTKFFPGMQAFYEEHMECVAADTALQSLAALA